MGHGYSACFRHRVAVPLLSFGRRGERDPGRPGGNRLARDAPTGAWGDGLVRKYLDRSLKDLYSWWPWRRRAAAEALGYSGAPRAVVPLCRRLGDWHKGTRMAAAVALGRLQDPRAALPLVARLADADRSVRAAAAFALAGTADVPAVARLIRNGTAAGPDDRAQALEALRHSSRSGSPQIPLLLLSREDGAFWLSATQALVEAANALLRKLERAGSWGQRDVEALADLDEARAIAALIRAVQAGDKSVVAYRPAVVTALESLSHTHLDALAQAALNQCAKRDYDVSLRNLGEWLAGRTRYCISFAEVANILIQAGEPAAVALLHALDPAQKNQRGAVADLLRQMPRAAMASAMLALLREAGRYSVASVHSVADEDPALYRATVQTWSLSALPDVGAALAALLEHPAPWARLWAAEAVGRRGRPGARQLLRPHHQSSADYDPLAAAVGLAYLGDASTIQVLRAALAHEGREWRLAAAGALAALGAEAGGALERLRALRAAEGDRAAQGVYAEALWRIDKALRNTPTELEASTAPAGRGTEPEAAPAPDGRGTEPEAYGG